MSRRLRSDGSPPRRRRRNWSGSSSSPTPTRSRWPCGAARTTAWDSASNRPSPATSARSWPTRLTCQPRYSTSSLNSASPTRRASSSTLPGLQPSGACGRNPQGVRLPGLQRVAGRRRAAWVPGRAGVLVPAAKRPDQRTQHPLGQWREGGRIAWQILESEVLQVPHQRLGLQARHARQPVTIASTAARARPGRPAPPAWRTAGARGTGCQRGGPLWSRPSASRAARRRPAPVGPAGTAAPARPPPPSARHPDFWHPTRSRQWITVGREQPTCSAIWVLDRPWAAASTILARWARPARMALDRVQRRSVCSSWPLRRMVAAVFGMREASHSHHLLSGDFRDGPLASIADAIPAQPPPTRRPSPSRRRTVEGSTSGRGAPGTSRRLRRWPRRTP
jgi:hypothetical protein